MLICRKAVIALILLAYSIFAYSFGVAVLQGRNGWLVFAGFILISRPHVIMCTPAIVLTVVGLPLFVAGSRELKKRPIKHPNLIASRACTILGVVLLVSSFHAFMWGFIPHMYTTSKGGGFIKMLIAFSPAFLLSLLLTISGFILLMVDSWRDLS